MPGDGEAKAAQETKVYVEHSFAKEEQGITAMITDLKNRIQKLEDNGKLQKGYGEQALSGAEAIGKRILALGSIDQEKWHDVKYSYCRNIESFLRTMNIPESLDRRRFLKSDFSILGKEGLSFLYAIVEQAENGKDLSDNDKINEFYQKEFEPNYVPNIEFRKRQKERDDRFNEWVKYRQEQQRRKEEEQKELRAFNRDVINFATEYMPMLKEQEKVLSDYSYSHSKMSGTGHWKISDTFDASTSRFYEEHRDESRKHLEEVFKVFDKERQMEAEMNADPKKAQILKAAKEFYYLKDLDIRDEIRRRDFEIRSTVNDLCRRLGSAETELFVERDTYDISFKKQLKAYEAIANDPLSPEKDEQIKKLHEEFVKYRQEHLKHTTHDFEIIQETFEQLEKLKGLSEEAAKYVDTQSAFSRKYFEQYKNWQNDYEKQMADHEKLLADNLDKYHHLTTDFDNKWNKTIEELRELITEGYDLEADVVRKLGATYGGKGKIVGVTPTNLPTFLSTHKVYKQNLESKKEEIGQKAAQALRLLEERDDLIEKIGDPSLKEKYDFGDVRYDGAKGHGNILDVVQTVQRALIQEQEDVDTASKEAREVAGDYYKELLEEKEYEAQRRQTEELLRQELDKELRIQRERLDREMQELEDECNRIDEELARTREQRYRNEDQVEYLNKIVDGLDREQQAGVLEAYGLSPDDREKFMNGQAHLLSFLNNTEKQDNKESTEKTDAGTKNTGTNPAKDPSKSKDLSVALAARQTLLNQINKNTNELYQDLLKRYDSVRTGNYSEEQKNTYYNEFTKEIENAQNSDRLTRGKLNMSEKVCNILALGQKIQLPVFEKDNLTVLQEAIKNREAVVDASVQAERLEEQRRASKEQLDHETKAAFDEMTKLIQESENSDKQLDTLRTDIDQFAKASKPKKINNYQNDYYDPRMKGLEEFHNRLNQQQLAQKENFQKMDVLRDKLKKLAAQTDDREVKDQFDEIFKQHDRVLGKSYQIMGYDLDTTLAHAREALDLDAKTTKNKEFSDELSKAETFAQRWLNDYDDVFKTNSVKGQIEGLGKLKQRYEENKTIIPSPEMMEERISDNEKFMDQHGIADEAKNVLAQQNHDLGDQYDRTNKKWNNVLQYADEIDSLIEEIAYDNKLNDIRNSLKSEYDSFKKLNNPKYTKNEAAKKFQNEMNEYLTISLDKTNQGNYSQQDRAEKPEQFLNSSLSYLKHLNEQLAGEDAREALRAYQEKGVMLNAFQKMAQLTEYYANDVLEKTLKNENEKSADDRRKVDAAVAKLKKENELRAETLKKEVQALNKYVDEKTTSIDAEFEKSDAFVSLNKEFDTAEKEAVEKSKNEVEQAKAQQNEKNAAFENGKIKDFPNDDAVLAENKSVKETLAKDTKTIETNLRGVGGERIDLERGLKPFAKSYDSEIGIKSNLKIYVNNEKQTLNTIQRNLNTLNDRMKEAKENNNEKDGVKGLNEVIKVCDAQLEFKKSLDGYDKSLHTNLEDLHTRAINNQNEIIKLHDDILAKQNQIKQNLTEEKDMHDQLAKKFTEAAEKQENLLKELKQKQHEDKIRRDIQDAFDAIKDTKDKGIGSHAKFHAFKAAMQEYLSSYPLGHPAADLTTDRANELNERAYQSCITYVNRHLKADNGKQSIAHQGTDEGALRKQGTVRILELMKELPEFKNKFELTADNPQIAEEASNAKDKAKNNTNDKRVKLNFNQLKNSLGEHSKTATSKKPEDFHINAYADLNAAINNKNKPQNNNGKRK